MTIPPIGYPPSLADNNLPTGSKQNYYMKCNYSICLLMTMHSCQNAGTTRCTKKCPVALGPSWVQQGAAGHLANSGLIQGASHSGQYIASLAIWSSWGRYASLWECTMPSNSVLDMSTKTCPLLDKGSYRWRPWVPKHWPFSSHIWPSCLSSLWYTFGMCYSSNIPGIWSPSPWDWLWQPWWMPQCTSYAHYRGKGWDLIWSTGLLCDSPWCPGECLAI